MFPARKVSCTLYKGLPVTSCRVGKTYFCSLNSDVDDMALMDARDRWFGCFLPCSDVSLTPNPLCTAHTIPAWEFFNLFAQRRLGSVLFSWREHQFGPAGVYIHIAAATMVKRALVDESSGIGHIAVRRVGAVIAAGRCAPSHPWTTYAP